MMNYDIIIIGGGPSGMTAALYALRSNKKVLILEHDSFGGQMAQSPKIENFPSIQQISGLELANQMFNQVLELGCVFELESVISLKKEKDTFIVKTNYNEYSSKSVIIANGVKHRLVNLPNEEKLIGKGISFCAMCDGPIYKDKETFVIGDANTALQYALMLSDICSKVHLITLFDRFFAEQVLVDRVLAKENIKVYHNLSLIEYVGEDSLTGLVFENTVEHNHLEFNTDNVFICIGQIPQNEIYKDLVDLNKGYIVTNDKMETKTKGLYACGDTRLKEIRQCVTACNDGAIAGLEASKYIG